MDPAGGDRARARYATAFTSSIFEPLPTPHGPAFVPAGKRRDQTTSEMFGSYDEKGLKGMPKTFNPKEPGFSARQKKLHFLSSDVLASSGYPTGAVASSPPAPRAAMAVAAARAEEADEVVDTQMRRQNDLSSKLFGRETPHSSAEQVHDRQRRLTPNDFKWNTLPERLQGPAAREGVTHADRAYQEKCSMVFDHTSPQSQGDNGEAARLAREEENEGEQRRRANVYYSDLFGRSTPMDAPQPQEGGGAQRRPKMQSSAEDRIVVHQDWTDSKTELMCQHSTSKPQEPHLRKSDELHQVRIFGQGHDYVPPDKLEPVTHDNSQRLKDTIGMSTQQIHQAHLRSSFAGERFYEDAENTKHWEVAELQVSGLPRTADDAYLRKFCQGSDLHIVKVIADMDPVCNVCKGRAKIMVRYNPKKESAGNLVGKFKASGFGVEL
eukprot:CAMPEP_0179246152 /NCGR_PEP_ID=MMETSP0797-20121207/18945_1 /TAXON_ID=47934 /ORGANISM="Dinophysis acuminata, Strain DAEP01" /LENGTH=436 /DNA_ID=CAMNT_0020953729 /DNA_START=72 /DNA_END=1382 /DNA_ORIENTATION=+